MSFFPGFECNNILIKLVSFTDGCEPGEGLCKNFVRYHLVGTAQRQEYQRQADAAVGQAVPDASANDMSIGANNMSICAKLAQFLRK